MSAPQYLQDRFGNAAGRPRLIRACVLQHSRQMWPFFVGKAAIGFVWPQRRHCFRSMTALLHIDRVILKMSSTADMFGFEFEIQMLTLHLDHSHYDLFFWPTNSMPLNQQNINSDE
jgi:hypothetical protein